jgi:predicted methyltransferase
MLTSAESPVVRHRLAWNGPPGTSHRLAQVRAGTLALLSPGQEPQPPAAQACASCGGAGFTSGQGDGDLAAVTRLRPPAATQIDQCHLDAESLNRRLSAITALRPAASSRVAFVGDDDLASVALLRTAPPAALLVADIDERVLTVIAAEAARLGTPGLAVLEHLNLTRPDDLSGLLDRHGESYDVVVTDPPYAEDGMRTFIQAAMALTGIGGELHAAVPALLAEAWSDELLWQVQQQLNAAGFVIERLVPGFFTYHGSDVISSLVVARRMSGSILHATAASRTETSRFYTTRAAPERLGLDVPLPDIHNHEE